MPRSPEQFEAMRQSSQEKIIRSACKLFTQFGYQSTSISMVARESGFSGGLIYAYFNDKEQLLYSVLAQTLSNMETVFATMSPIDPKLIPVPERIDLSFEIILKRIDCLKLMIHLMMQDGTPEPAVEKIKLLSQRFKDHMEQLFPEPRCANLPSMIHASITSYLVYHNEELFNQQKQTIRQLAERYQSEISEAVRTTRVI